MRFGEFFLLIFKTINTILLFCGYMEKSVSWKMKLAGLVNWEEPDPLLLDSSQVHVRYVLVKFGSIWEESEKNLRVKDQAQLQISEDNIDNHSTVCSNSSSQQRRPNQHAFTILDFVHHIIVAARRRYLRFFFRSGKMCLVQLLIISLCQHLTLES